MPCVYQFHHSPLACIPHATNANANAQGTSLSSSLALRGMGARAKERSLRIAQQLCQEADRYGETDAGRLAQCGFPSALHENHIDDTDHTSGLDIVHRTTAIAWIGRRVELKYVEGARAHTSNHFWIELLCGWARQCDRSDGRDHTSVRHRRKTKQVGNGKTGESERLALSHLVRIV